jgi:hypothetical protein
MDSEVPQKYSPHQKHKVMAQLHSLAKLEENLRGTSNLGIISVLNDVIQLIIYGHA